MPFSTSKYLAITSYIHLAHFPSRSHLYENAHCVFTKFHPGYHIVSLSTQHIMDMCVHVHTCCVCTFYGSDLIAASYVMMMRREREPSLYSSSSTTMSGGAAMCIVLFCREELLHIFFRQPKRRSLSHRCGVVCMLHMMHICSFNRMWPLQHELHGLIITGRSETPLHRIIMCTLSTTYYTSLDIYSHLCLMAETTRTKPAIDIRYNEYNI